MGKYSCIFFIKVPKESHQNVCHHLCEKPWVMVSKKLKCKPELYLNQEPLKVPWRESLVGKFILYTRIEHIWGARCAASAYDLLSVWCLSVLPSALQYLGGTDAVSQTLGYRFPRSAVGSIVWKCSWIRLLCRRHLCSLQSELCCSFLCHVERWAPVHPRRNQFSWRLNSPTRQPDSASRCWQNWPFCKPIQTSFPPPEIWIFLIFILATRFDLPQRCRENVKRAVAERSGSLSRVQDPRSFSLLMEGSTRCI